MPNIKSAKKRVKVIATKTAQNKAVKSALKTVIKKAYYAVDTNAANKTEAVSLAMKKIDQAAAKGILCFFCFYVDIFLKNGRIYLDNTHIILPLI